MRTLFDDNHADAAMIGGVVGILVTLIISVLVLYSIAGSVDTDTADENIRENVYGEGGTTYVNGTIYAANSTEQILGQSETFFTIAPIIAIVVVAVVILLSLIHI